jgi:hypothetical protein
MSKHSKHGRGKHFRKMQKMRQMQQGAGVMQSSAGVAPPVAGNIPRATAPAASVVPVPQAPIQKKPVSSAALPLHYTYIGGDLKRIGILTAIIVAILIVLYLFLK